jgi:hypothetical protein
MLILLRACGRAVLSIQDVLCLAPWFLPCGAACLPACLPATPLSVLSSCPGHPAVQTLSLSCCKAAPQLWRTSRRRLLPPLLPLL